MVQDLNKTNSFSQGPKQPPCLRALDPPNHMQAAQLYSANRGPVRDKAARPKRGSQRVGGSQWAGAVPAGEPRGRARLGCAGRGRLQGRAGRRDWSTPNTDLGKVLLKLMGQCGPAHANETRTTTRGISMWEGAVR